MSISTITKIMHSVVGITMISLLVVGIYMTETETFSLFPLHKSIGVIVFIFALFRVFVRIKEGWPEPIGSISNIQLVLAKIVHWGLIIMTLLYPISGMMMSGGGGHGVPIFGFELIASNHDQITGKAVAINEGISSIGHTLHESLTLVLIAFIVLHVAGAIKHHIVNKDETLSRMFSFKNKR